MEDYVFELKFNHRQLRRLRHSIVSVVNPARRVSQTEAADAIGISQTMLSRYERGPFFPPRDILERIIKYYGSKRTKMSVDFWENV